jgi:histone H3
MDIKPKTIFSKKKKNHFFETYISKVLKQVSKTNGITSNAKQQLNSILCIIMKIICSYGASLTEIAKKKTLSEKEIINALRVILPENLSKNAILQGVKSIENFKDKSRKGISRQEKAGITFPPSIAEKFLRNFGYSKIMITSTAPVCLASAIEYLAYEILEYSTQSAKYNKRVRITIRDLELAVRNDVELNDFFIRYNISFIGGGNVPFIHSSLLYKKNRKKTIIKQKTDSDIKKPHRFRPGTVAVREIKKYQKLSNCLTFAKFPFEKFVRQILTKKNCDKPIKISKEVFIILQYFIEQYVVSVLKDANLAAIHAGRVKLMPIDINFVNSVRNGTSKNTYNHKIDVKSSILIDEEDEQKEEEFEEEEFEDEEFEEEEFEDEEFEEEEIEEEED